MLFTTSPAYSVHLMFSYSTFYVTSVYIFCKLIFFIKPYVKSNAVIVVVCKCSTSIAPAYLTIQTRRRNKNKIVWRNYKRGQARIFIGTYSAMPAKHFCIRWSLKSRFGNAIGEWIIN